MKVGGFTAWPRCAPVRGVLLRKGGCSETATVFRGRLGGAPGGAFLRVPVPNTAARNWARGLK